MELAPILDEDEANAHADEHLRMCILQVCREAARTGEARRLMIDLGLESLLDRGTQVWALVHILHEMDRRGDVADYGATLAAIVAAPDHLKGRASVTLEEADRLPHTTMIDWYINQVSAAFVKRRAADDLAELVRACRNSHEPAEIVQTGKQILARLESAGTASVQALPRFDFSADLPPAPPPLVGDENQQLIVQGNKVAVAADSGTGKTKALTEIAFGIASGKAALGFPCQQQPVIYISSDGDPDFERNIRRQWEGRGGTLEELKGLPLHVWADEAFVLEDAACHSRLRKTLDTMGAAKRPVTLIIETIATNVSVTDLNDQAAVRQFISRKVGALMSEFPGLTVIMSHHLRKPQQGGKNDLGVRVAGSVQIRAAFDSIIGLTVSGKDAFTVRRIKRSRSGGDFEAFKVQIRDVAGKGGPLSVTNEGPADVSLTEARGAARDVLQFMRLSPGPVDLKAIVSTIKNARPRAVQDACKRLSESDRPRLRRLSKKPASYEYIPGDDAEDLDGFE